MKQKSIRIATRKSELAIVQAEHVKNMIRTIHPHVEVTLIPMATEGDKNLDTALSKIGGKGLFLKELEIALQNNEADIAVHSMKDVPVELPNDLTLEVICERIDPRDAFVANDYLSIDELPEGASVGTSSLRRQCQLLHLRPDLKIEALRGNVNTRLQKLDDGKYDAIILAAAGLIRLKQQERIKRLLPADLFIPAVGQGALGIECRKKDTELLTLLRSINDESSSICLAAERRVNEILNGSCQVPIGAHAMKHGPTLSMHAMVGRPSDNMIIKTTLSGSAYNPQLLGTLVANDLIEQGAKRIINDLLSIDESEDELNNE